MRGSPTTKPARLLAFCVLALAVTGVVQAANLFRQNLQFTRAETEVSFWGRGDYHPAESTIERTVLAMECLLSGQPGHPDYLGLQANASAWLAYWARQAVRRDQYAGQAITAQYSAVQSRPAHRHSWAKMVEYLSRAGGHKPLAKMAQLRLDALRAKSTAKVNSI